MMLTMAHSANSFYWLRNLCVLLLTLNLHHVFGKKLKIAPRPHIIMIVADDLGWDDVSFHGSPQIPTPHIDKLANDGVILNSYYVSPICTPTRASLMTGKHPVNLGIQHGTIFGTQPYGLPLAETTTPQYLKSLGYRTHGVGKWHLGFFEKEYTPRYRGFETFYGFWNGKEDYWDHSSQEDVWGTDLRNNMKAVRNESNHYGTELFTEVAERIIDTHNKSTPLYLYLAQQAVHSANEHEPLQAPQRLLNKFPHFSSDERRTYAAMVASLDESVGNITKALKRNDLFDNSVIVFTTDNGGAPRGFNWNQGCNYPFKGGKDTFWEGGVRGVGFVHSNLISRKGRVSYDLIDVTDWLPTFYHLAGGDVTQIQNKIDGMNVWDTIAHEAKSPRTEVLHNIDPIRKFAAIRVDQYKLIINQDAVFKTTWLPRYDVIGELDDLPQPHTLPGAVIECGKWYNSKKANCDTNVFPCLFDISKDPCEYRNLAHTHLHKVRDLLVRLIHYQANARPVWFPEREPAANPLGGLQGYWGPWKSSKANKRILEKAIEAIPHVSGSSAGSVLISTHKSKDKEVYQMLHSLLRVTTGGKKGGIPGNVTGIIAKETLAKLFAKMKQKTEVDDLIHKLQMIKKGRVAKLRAFQANKKTVAHRKGTKHDFVRKWKDSVSEGDRTARKRTKVDDGSEKYGNDNVVVASGSTGKERKMPVRLYEDQGLNNQETQAGLNVNEFGQENSNVESSIGVINQLIQTKDDDESTQGSADINQKVTQAGVNTNEFGQENSNVESVKGEIKQQLQTKDDGESTQGSADINQKVTQAGVNTNKFGQENSNVESSIGVINQLIQTKDDDESKQGSADINQEGTQAGVKTNEFGQRNSNVESGISVINQLIQTKKDDDESTQGSADINQEGTQAGVNTNEFGQENSNVESGISDINQQLQTKKDDDESTQGSADSDSITSGEGSGNEFYSGDDINEGDDVGDDVNGSGDDDDNEDGDDEDNQDDQDSQDDEEEIDQ